MDPVGPARPARPDAFHDHLVPLLPPGGPHYKAIYERYRPLGLEMVNIDIQETKEKVARFADHNALPYPILLGETGEVAQAYGVVGVPFTALLDRDGRVVCLPCRSLDMELSALYPAAP